MELIEWGREIGRERIYARSVLQDPYIERCRKAFSLVEYGTFVRRADKYTWLVLIRLLDTYTHDAHQPLAIMVTSYVVVTLVERSHLLNPCSSSISGFLLFTRAHTQIYRKYVCCWFRDTHKLGFTTTAEIPETVILWFLCLSTRRESEIGRPGPESAPALDIERE